MFKQKPYILISNNEIKNSFYLFSDAWIEATLLEAECLIIGEYGKFWHISPVTKN